MILIKTICEIDICFYSNISYFYPLEVVCRGSETQLQVGKKLNYLTKRFSGW